MPKIFLDNNTIWDLSEIVANQLNLLYGDRVINILTFSNGGLNATGCIARAGLRRKPTVFSFNPGPFFSKKSKMITHLIETMQMFEPLILVDDILDTGVTSNSIENILGESIPAYFLVDKTGDHRVFTPKVHYAGKVYATSSWIVFPWERENK